MTTFRSPAATPLADAVPPGAMCHTLVRSATAHPAPVVRRLRGGREVVVVQRDDTLILERDEARRLARALLRVTRS